MSKKTYGILSFTPIVLYIVSLVLIGIGAVSAATGAAQNMSRTALATLAIVAGGLAIVAAILLYVVMIMLIVKTCKNPMFSDSQKIGWSLVLFFFNLVAFPIYWFVVIRKE